MKREFGIDTLRTIAAFLIISHHVSYPAVPNLFSILSKIIGQWALPFFFVISGYFLTCKGELYTRSMKTIQRIIWITIIWSILYIPLRLFTDGLIDGITNIISLSFLNKTHLWFLIALVIGFLTINFIETYRLNKIVFPLSILFLTYYYFSSPNYINAFYPNLEVPENIRNYLYGITWIFYGHYLSQNKTLSLRLSYILVIVGFISSIIEGYLLGVTLSYIGTIPLVIGIVNIALNGPNFLKWNKVSKIGGRYGLGIYLIHPYIIWIILRIDKNYTLNLYQNPIFNLLFPIFIFVSSIIFFHLTYKFLPKTYLLITGNINRKIN